MDADKVNALIETWRARFRGVWNVVAVPLGLRTLMLAGLAYWLLSRDWTATKSFAFGLGLVAAALAFLHWYRKTQHPYLDLQAFSNKALEQPLASAIVLASVFGFMGVVLIFLLFVVVR
jgi:FtsH-binding integral membrane protein